MHKIKRISFLDHMRALAALAVVVLHVSGAFTYQYKVLDKADWWAANFFDALVRFSVPIFIMLSGYVLLGREETYVEFFKKRFSRILLPFFFWSCLYLIYYFIRKNAQGYEFTIIEIIKRIGLKMIQRPSFHLWYVYMIIGLYLLVPLLSRALKQFTTRELEYYLIIWLVLMFITPMLKKLGSNLNTQYFTGFLGYFLLGYYLKIKKWSVLQSKLWGWLMFMSGFLCTFLLTGYFSHKYHTFYETYYGYLKPNVLLQSVGFFVLFMNNEKKIPFTSTISDSSYGIYLAHILVMNGLFYISANWHISLWIYIPVISVACFAISFALVYALKQIKPLRLFIG